jgi:drug/metabolite transporter (DMT)-like permease
MTVQCTGIAGTVRDTRTRRSTRRGALAMVLAATSWGFSTVANKLTLDRTHLRPMSLQSMQLAASVLVLSSVAVIRGKRPSASAWRVGRTGLAEPGGSYVLGLIGLSMTSATHVAITGAIEPTLVAVGAWVVLRERVARRTAALMATTLAGALVVVTANPATGSNATLGGDTLVVTSVCCAAAYVLLSSRSAGRIEPLTATLTQQTWAIAVVLPALAISIAIGGLGPVPHGSGWLLVVVSGLLSYLIPFVLYLTAVESITAAMAAQYLALIPLTGMIGATTILGEPIMIRSLIGGAVVVVALYRMARTESSNPVDDDSHRVLD